MKKRPGRPKGGRKYDEWAFVQFKMELNEKELWQEFAEIMDQSLSDFIKERTRIGISLIEIESIKEEYEEQREQFQDYLDDFYWYMWFLMRALEVPDLFEVFFSTMMKQAQVSIKEYIEEISNKEMLESIKRSMIEGIDETQKVLQKRMEELKEKQKD